MPVGDVGRAHPVQIEGGGESRSPAFGAGGRRVGAGGVLSMPAFLPAAHFPRQGFGRGGLSRGAGRAISAP